jgi:hypothetical protein
MGELQEARSAVLLVGTARCGTPAKEVADAILATTDVERLRRMIRVAATATTWEAVTATT